MREYMFVIVNETEQCVLSTNLRWFELFKMQKDPSLVRFLLGFKNDPANVVCWFANSCVVVKMRADKFASKYEIDIPYDSMTTIENNPEKYPQFLLHKPSNEPERQAFQYVIRNGLSGVQNMILEADNSSNNIGHRARMLFASYLAQTYGHVDEVSPDSKCILQGPNNLSEFLIEIERILTSLIEILNDLDNLTSERFYKVNDLASRQEDLLHIIEFAKLGAADQSRIVSELQETRIERRVVKDEQDILMEIKEQLGPDCVSSIKSILYKISKLRNRLYTTKTITNEELHKLIPNEKTFGRIYAGEADLGTKGKK